ncbi:MAG: aldehyde dehydrogenase family protein [Gammaproteobacteria bacterium]|nr:aldehyde dehydrogenase family protein [Gammaproteobacteria bacterium]
MNSLKCVSPVDNTVYVERKYADASDIAQALQRSAKAQKSWKITSIEERQRLCSKAVDLFVEQKETISQELVWQMGRPVSFAPFEIDGFEERARHMIDIAVDALKPVTPAPKPGFNRYIKREPLGVVFVVAPWNFPYLTSVNAIMPALLAGNSVILKHSAQTPLCAERLHDAFSAAGFPEGVFQYLHLNHDDTQKVIQSDEVDFVAFTGSVAGGKMVEDAAAGRFIGVGLELGGKDPAYVRSDAKLDHAIETLVDGAFFNSGQSCCGIERIYVHQSVYDDFLGGAVALMNQYILGRPDNAATTLGPMVKAGAADFVRDQTRAAVSAGAVMHTQMDNFPLERTGTPYLAPQILTNVDHSMRVMREESFGPIIGIMPVKNDQTAIELMNDSQYGLTACVFTQDEEAAIRIGEQVETGTWFMNRCDYLDPALAWTGVKDSGRGCTLSSVGFEHVTRPKSYHLKSV